MDSPCFKPKEEPLSEMRDNVNVECFHLVPWKVLCKGMPAPPYESNPPWFFTTGIANIGGNICASDSHFFSNFFPIIFFSLRFDPPDFKGNFDILAGKIIDLWWGIMLNSAESIPQTQQAEMPSC